MKVSDRYHEINITNDYGRGGAIWYIAEIRHSGLGTYRILKDKEQSFLHNKMKAQFDSWDSTWEKVSTKQNALASKQQNQFLADERTNEAKDRIAEVDRILKHTLEIDDTVNWSKLKDKSSFKEENPKKQLEVELRNIKDPVRSQDKSLPKEPDPSEYFPNLSLFDKLFKSVGQKKQAKAEKALKEDMLLWRKQVSDVKKYNAGQEAEFQNKLKRANETRLQVNEAYKKLEEEWSQKLDAFYEAQKTHNLKVGQLKDAYSKREAVAVVEYCDLVLNNSEYPDSFPKDFDLQYDDEKKLLIVDYVLPSPENMPNIQEVKYVASKNEIKEVLLSDSQIAKMYDTAVYNIVLRTIHELFEADKIDAIDCIILNGWVRGINKANGKNSNSCIVSLQVLKNEFLQIDLANVDPKLCFKNLKGIGSSKLAGITPIQPILQINKDDKRFVSSYDVTDSLDNLSNLAAMGWEDFEHLIRELFEKEFSVNGGEVKVTQASRDGGVDAIAFDPDPLRGGKIVIQAKRYTNTVGVSAVRDLYGTVLNEGATKGILVTTSDYGPDAYNFAKNKPLALLSGSNLLYLLEKHGHRAKIDIAAAKALYKASLA